jgi:uncharacterized protein DUF3858
MKFWLFFYIVFLSYTVCCQTTGIPYELGNVSNKELKLKVYSKDSTANAIVLYDKVYLKIINRKKKSYLQSTYYYKIKIFNKNAYDYATNTILMFNSGGNKDKVYNIIGITHNLEGNKDVKTYLKKSDIFKTKKSDFFYEVTFTLPKIKEGSVLEVKYVTETPYWLNFNAWKPQSDLPHVYSELYALIPSRWYYNLHLYNLDSLDVHKRYIKKKCYNVEGHLNDKYCLEFQFVKKYIPAFKEDSYYTSKSNFIPRIDFQLSMYKSPHGYMSFYAYSWGKMDEDFKNYSFIASELKKYKKFKRLLPDSLRSIKNEYNKAVKVYHFIQNHYNNSNIIKKPKTSTVKNIFKSKFGNASQINISLINALKASGIKAYVFLLSTRENGIPTKKATLLDEFNYLIAVAKIDNTYYQLDASDKLLSYGQLPFEALNGFGRRMDLENGSTWQSIVSKPYLNKTSFNVTFKDNKFTGFLRIVSNGYVAKDKRFEIISNNQKKYIKTIENYSDIPDINIISYRNKNLKNVEKPFIEDFKIEYEQYDNSDDLLIINPYFNKFSENPFRLEKRSYPVDFGYPSSRVYQYTIIIPDNYTISSIPKDFTKILNNNTASLIAKNKIINNKINIEFEFNLNKAVYEPSEYNDLKNLFQNLINLQKQLIVLKKKK